jgi:hypothetical protein
MFILIKEMGKKDDMIVNIDRISAIVRDDGHYVIFMDGVLYKEITHVEYKELLEVLKVHKLLIVVKNGEKPAL